MSIQTEEEIEETIEDGNNDPPGRKQAKNAVNNALRDGKINKPDKCGKCGGDGKLGAHHHKGYDEKNWLDVQWLCRSCHNEADAKMRKKEKKKTEKNSDHSFAEVEGRERRLDFFGFVYDPENKTLGDKDGMIEQPFVEDEHGFLKGRAIVTNIGVFPYLLADGSVRFELRPPEEVLAPDSLQTMADSILANDHPLVPVTVENQDQVCVGFIGEGIRNDAYHVSAPIMITDKETIQDVKAGKRGLSAGYFPDIEFTPGTWMGVHYDAIQRNIRYNHVAIVDRGRAGDAARIKMDSADCQLAVCDHFAQKSKQEDQNMALKKITLDGVEYEAEAEVVKTLNQQKERADTLDKELVAEKGSTAEKQVEFDKLEADRDAQKDRADKSEKELQELKDSKPDKEAIDAAIKARTILLDAAKKAEVEVKEDMSDADIRKAVILKASPEAKLDEKSEDYIQARFDSAVEMLGNRNDAENRETVKDPADLQTQEVNADKALDDYEKRMYNRSRDKED